MDENMECQLSMLDDMTTGALVQYKIIDGVYESIPPTTLNSSMIEFRVHSSEHFIELDKTELEIFFRVKKADNNNLAAQEKVSIINYTGATLFKDIEVELNDKTITYAGSNYAERAMMETLLSFGKDAGTSWLQAGLYYKDTAGKMDTAEPNPADGATTNDGLKKRAEFTANSKLVHTKAKLHLDIFNQPKPLINNVRMVLKLSRNPDKYVLMSPEEGAAYKVEIEKIYLNVRKVKVADDVIKNIIGESVPYPITRVVQKEFTIPSGGKSFTENNLWDGVLPTKVAFGLVLNTAHVGSYKENPFNYQNFDVSNVSLRENGQVIDGRPLTLDYENNQYLDGYWGLQRALDKRFRDEGSQISRSDYKNGYALYAFDLSPSQCADQFVDPIKKGKLTLELQFAKPIPKTLTLCVYLQFEASFVINEAREVVTKFSG